MLSDRLIRLVNRQEKSITDAENALLDGLTPIERKIFAATKGQLNKMKKTGGKYDFDAGNVNLVNELDQVILNEIQTSSFPENVSKYLQNFDSVTDYQSELHESLNDIKPAELRKLVDPFKKQMVQDTLNGLTGSGVASEFIEPVRQALFQNIVAGANSTEIEGILRKMIQGDAENISKLNRYVGQVTRDSLNQFEGQVNGRIADEFGLDAFQYVGSLVEDSRSQCVKWVNKSVLLKEELPALISSAFSSGQGMIPGTNSGNFAVYRGGYNCRHSAIPFKMTKRERERLNKEEEVNVEEEEVTATKNIEEVERSIKDNKKKKSIASSKTKAKKTELNQDLLISTRPKSINDQALSNISDQDGAAEIMNEFNTTFTIRNSSEAGKAGTAKFLRTTGRTDLTPNSIGVYSNGTQGFCAVSNKFLSIKMKRNDVIRPTIDARAVGIKSENPFSPNSNDLDNWIETSNSDWYGKNSTGVFRRNSKGSSQGSYILQKKNGKTKYFGIDEMLNVDNENFSDVTSVLTHENGHLIQNKFDPKVGNTRPKMLESLKKHNVKLDESLTWYGETNQSELYAETFSAYVHANADFKKHSPKLFDWFEDLTFNVYGIDKKTIILSK